jgi:hypothetical protein
MKSTHTTSSYLNDHVKNKHRGLPLNEEDEARTLKAVPADASDSYQGFYYVPSLLARFT